MHELVHALQDQYINLDSLEHIAGDDDRAAAAQAVDRGAGDVRADLPHGGRLGQLAAQLPGGWESMRTTIREAQATQPVFASAPMVIQETLSFRTSTAPTSSGGSRRSDRASLPFDSLPVSTEQLMHDSAYFGSAADVPSADRAARRFRARSTRTISASSARGSSSSSTRAIRIGRSARRTDGMATATRWSRRRRATRWSWATVWDSPGDAAEFMSAIDEVMAKRFNVKPRVTGERRHFDTAKRTIDVDVREIGGRPVVLYIDVPAGSSTNLVDFAKVKVTPR